MTLNGPPPAVYARRRAAVLDHLDGAVMFISGPPEAVYSNDVHYPYRPDTNIRYLTGFEEPGSVLLSHCGHDEKGVTLFVRPRDPDAETWTGRRAGTDGARARYGADHAYPLEDALKVLEHHLSHAERLYYSHSVDRAINERVMDIVHRVNLARPRTGAPHLVVSDVRALLDEQRLVKDDDELALMQRACDISGEAHRRLIETMLPGMTEYQLQAQLEHDLRWKGCTGPAYGTIAAAGDNATILHYTRNDGVLTDGRLVLVDAGGEYGGYCADITRTWPVGTSFSKPQAELYDIVLAAQAAALEHVRPGAAIDDPHEAAVRTLAQGLIDIGALCGTLEECLEKQDYRGFYMHRTSHWLGMDVHDAGAYRVDGRPRTLSAGMVLTVEPGLYVAADCKSAGEHAGIGIRIEDDVVVTDAGCRILTNAAPKERKELERLRAKALARA